MQEGLIKSWDEWDRIITVDLEKWRALSGQGKHNFMDKIRLHMKTFEEKNRVYYDFRVELVPGVTLATCWSDYSIEIEYIY